MLTQSRDRQSLALFLFAGAIALAGCDGIQKQAKTEDPAIVRQGNRVVVASSSPLFSRLETEAAQLTTVHRQVAAPASVEADPARYARSSGIAASPTRLLLVRQSRAR